ncbi:MAG: hypothetical protein R3F61_15485 [Myxococcota bacterium]
MADAREEALREASALTKGFRSFFADLRGDREERLAAAVETAQLCAEEIKRLRRDYDNRIMELDPEKGEELAMMEEREVLMERAATVRKMGGVQRDMLEKIEGERRQRTGYVESLEHTLATGERALKALLEYERRLNDNEARLDDGFTARMGRLASIATAGAEALESLEHFIERVGVADVSMIRIFQQKKPDPALELRNCERNLKDVRALITKTETDLVGARQELRPIEAAYRNFLIAATQGQAPQRMERPVRS